MNIRSILTRILSFFSSPAAEKVLDKIADFVPVALPYIDVAAEIMAGVTPTTIDDVALQMIKGKYPQLFDGSLKSGDQVKLFGLGVAADLLKNKFPQLNTSIARAAVQLAYTAHTADSK